MATQAISRSICARYQLAVGPDTPSRLVAQNPGWGSRRAILEGSYTARVSEDERERLRGRVASGTASGDDRDRLASTLARALRERDDREPAAIEAIIDELRGLADAGSDRSSCTDALAGALLDAQIRAFERRDAADAWRRLDEIRARLLAGGTPDLLHDRLAAALYNACRGGELLADEPMRLAALEELRTRSHGDPSASACRVALAELLADALAHACRRAEFEQAERAYAELERLHRRDGGLAIARELGRALRELLRLGVGVGPFGEPAAVVARLQALVSSFTLAPGDALERRLAEALVHVHAQALRSADELEDEGVERCGAEVEALREQLRDLADRAIEQRPSRAAPLIRELGKALHDAAVLGLGNRPPDPAALAELRELVERHEHDAELRAQLMSALFQLHRGAIERDDPDLVERLQVDADALLARDEAVELELDHREPTPALLRPRAREIERALRARAELRLDHLQILLATHAAAGDRGDWVRAEQLLARARELVVRANSPREMVEVFGQMLVNAHVDAGARNREQALREQLMRARALLIELRELVRAHPHSSTLALHLATALFNAHVEAGRRDSSIQAARLLDELELLHREHPGQLELRRRLVMALVNHHGDALERHDFVRASTLLERVRELVRSPDADNHLRVQLAMALGNALAHVDDPECGEDNKRIVSELRVLAAREDASDTLRALVLDELSERFAPQQ
jgi:hypothetical protein